MSALGRRFFCCLTLALGACSVPRQVALDLVAGLQDAEVRSDSLDLPFLAADPYFARRGMGALEGSGAQRSAWLLAERARVVLPFHSAADKELLLKARCHDGLGPALPLALALNDVPLGRVTLTPTEQEFRLVLPAAAQARGDNVLSFQAPRRYQPRPGDRDRRALVAAISALTVRPLGGSTRTLVPGKDGARLLLAPFSSVAYYLRVPRGARLALESETSAGGHLVATLEQDAASPERGRATLVEAATSGRREVGLEPRAGTIARLELANTGLGLVRVAQARLTVPHAEAVAAPSTLRGERPSLVVYLVDTLRADHLGAYGQRAPTSPQLDAFAREALLFEDAWAQASWTRSAIASVFTGLHVGTHGVDREDRVLPRGLPTLAEALKAAGYRTGAFVGNHLLGGRFGFQRGFDSWNGGDEKLYGEPAETLVERGLAWLDAASGPAFLYLHVMEPHAPYEPNEQDWAPFKNGEYTGDRDTRALLRLGQLGQLAPAGLAFLESRYQGEVRQSDRAFGALVDGLRARGRLERAVVVFTADHGEELLDHGGTEHAKTLYQELVRVPLVVRVPGVAAARRGETVQQVDLLPTLLGLLGLSAPAGVQGRDLSALWRGARAEGLPPLVFSEERFAVIDKLAARAGPFKLIFNNDGPELWRAKSHEELYDLESDPLERKNLLQARPIVATFLRQRLERFREAQAALKRAEDQTVTLSEQEKEQLRALGYVQ